MRVLSTLWGQISIWDRNILREAKKKRMRDSPALGVGTVVHIIGWLVLSCRLHFDRSQLFGASPALSENSVQLANPRHGDPNGASHRVESHESYHRALRAVRGKKTTRHLPIRRYRLLHGHETHVRTHGSPFLARSGSEIRHNQRERERGEGEEEDPCYLRGAPPNPAHLMHCVYILTACASFAPPPYPHAVSLARSLDTVEPLSLLIFFFLHHSALSYGACAEWTSCARNQFPHFRFYAKRSENFTVSVHREDNCFRIEKFYRFSFFS